MMGEVRPHLVFHPGAEEPFRVNFYMAIVCMGDDDGDAPLGCFFIEEIARLRALPMDNLVFGVLIEEGRYLPGVFPKGVWAERHHAVDLPAQGGYLIFEVTFLLTVNYEVELHFRAVNLTVVVHHH